MQLVGRSAQFGYEIDHAGVAEGSHELSRRGVQLDQPPAAVHQNSSLLAAGPQRHATVDEARAVRWLPEVVGLGVVLPDEAPRVGVERDHAIVGRAQVHRVVHHKRRRLKVARAHALVGDRRLAGAPLPCHLEPRDVVTIDCRCFRIFGGCGVGAVDGPIDALRSSVIR